MSAKFLTWLHSHGIHVIPRAPASQAYVIRALACHFSSDDRAPAKQDDEINEICTALIGPDWRDL